MGHGGRTSPEFWLERAGVPKRFRDTDFSDFSPVENAAALQATKDLDARLAEGTHEGVGLLLAGPPGRGKTMLAATLVRRHVLRHPPDNVYDHEVPAVFTTLARYQDLLRRAMDLDRWAGRAEPEERAELLSQWRNLQRRREFLQREVELLVVDDVGKEHHTATRFIADEFDLLLRERFDLGLVTVLTTNAGRQAITSLFSPSMASFLNEATEVLVLNDGPDWREL